MFKQIFILLFIGIFLISCGTGKEDAKKFNEDYKVLSQKLKENRTKVKTRDEYAAYNSEKKTELENLLKKYEESPATEEIEILRSKVLLGLEKFDDAEKIIDALIAKNPEKITDAQMVKVKILIGKKKHDDAFSIFKEIEPKITDQDDLFYAYYQFGTEHGDCKTREEYATKFLSSKIIPESYLKSKNYMYFYLSEALKEQGDLEKARKTLKDGMADTSDEREQKFLQAALDQLNYFGQPAFPISVPHWINSSPVEISSLKGQVVILSFWAPWCPSCRELTPTLVEIYNENKDKGFTIIGYSRLYGTYRDDEADKGKVTEEEELELIKGYIERKKMTYPVGIASAKEAFDSYKISGLPTLIFVDKKGNIEFTKIGGGSIDFLKNKIKTLLEAQ
jgi:thiol-disulfide isomerase/thioredoxin